MPDLQSELTKILNQKGFDDEKTPKEQAMTAPKQEPTMRWKVWKYVKDNPSVTTKQIAEALGLAHSTGSAHCKHLIDAGILERTMHDDTYYYIVGVDEYNPVDRGEAMRAGWARKLAENGGKMPRKPKVKKTKAAKQSKENRESAKRQRINAPLGILERMADDAPPAKSLTQMKAELIGEHGSGFDPDKILAGLNVLQAKQLLAKLNELFAV